MTPGEQRAEVDIIKRDARATAREELFGAPDEDVPPPPEGFVMVE